MSGAGSLGELQLRIYWHTIPYVGGGGGGEEIAQASYLLAGS